MGQEWQASQTSSKEVKAGVALPKPFGDVCLPTAGAPCRPVLSPPPHVAPSPRRDHASSRRCLYGGAAASPPVTIRNLPQPAPPPSHPFGGIRRELTAQTPRLQRGEGRGREEGVERRALGRQGLFSLCPLCLASVAQLWEPLTYGQITWVWHAWWGLCVGKRSLKPGWTPSRSQLQEQRVRHPAWNRHQLLNACAPSANTTASPGPSISPTCSRMRRAGCCVPSCVTMCAPSAVPRVTVPTHAVSARSPARATPLSTATPLATQLARRCPGLTRQGCKIQGIAEAAQELQRVQVAGGPGVEGASPGLVAKPLGLVK